MHPQSIRPARALVHRQLSLLLTTACLSVTASNAVAQVGPNLLINPGFTGGLMGWTTVSSSASVVSYGAPGVPATGVAAVIGGGARLLRDTGGSAIVEQIVNLGAVPTGSYLLAGGYFGGGPRDGASLVARFLDSGGVEIGRQLLPTVTDRVRNFETVLMLRQAALVPPAGTVSVAARIEFLDTSCCVATGAADEVFLRLVNGSPIPPAQSMNTELLNNPGFEDGWAAGSPLSLDDSRGWEGNGAAATVVKPYSDTDPLVPSTIVACLIGGGRPSTSCQQGGAGNLLGHTGQSGVRQRIDVRGNETQIRAGSLSLSLAAFLGGVGTLTDTAQVDVRFLDRSLTSIAPLSPIGPVTRDARNAETVVLRRVREYLVPSTTAYIDVEVGFVDVSCCTAVALADNISAMLVTPSTQAPVPLDVNLISNPSFDAGSLPGSPLELTNPNGWCGRGSSTRVVAYGSSGEAPPASFSTANMLGGSLLRDSSNAVLTQTIDFTGSRALIAASRLRLRTQAWLGGHSTIADSVEVRIRLENIAGVQLGILRSLSPVTPADRMNQTTLLQRSLDFPVLPGTARAVLEVRFADFSCCAAHALIDDVRLVAYDVVNGGPSRYVGTGEDLRLLSGINGPPTTGLGFEIKSAVGDDVLTLRVESPGGDFDYTPMLLAANLFATGSPPSPIGGVVLSPTFPLVVLQNGLTCSGVFCPLVLPGGTTSNFAIPRGLTGASLLIQGLAFPRMGQMQPSNGVFASTEGHEIRL